MLYLLLLSCQHTVSPLSDVQLAQADGVDGQWLLHGLDYAETRFSPLTQIDTHSVSRLGLKWSLDLGLKRGIEATPLVHNGIMYLTGPWSKVFALDARTGQIIWQYDPGVDGSYGEKGCCDVVNRGVAIYQDKVFVGAFDGRLIALNALDGTLAWETQTVDPAKPYTITGAPRVVNGLVIIGNGGAELGVRGYFSAYDANSGKMKWRFYTVPGNPEEPFENEAMEMAAKTWTGEWWKYGGGGTAWDAMAYDPALNLLYVGTGNGSPWDRNKRSPQGGDNLFLSSILAINPDNGSLVWHYQTTPGDSWDFTATQHIILADLTIDGKKRKVLMQAPKNGFFYVLDRTDGSLISAEKFTYVNWAKYVDPASGRPVETEFARYANANADIAPNYNGAHNWQPMAFNPKHGLVYIPARETFSNYGLDNEWVYNTRGFGTGAGWNLAIGTDPRNPTIKDDKASIQGKLIAWDPVKQTKVWEVLQSEIWGGGLLATAGDLVFQGSANGKFSAYHARSGKVLWEVPLQTGIISSPVTYLLDGVQYVTIITGWGGGYGMKNKHTNAVLPGVVYTFALDATGELPAEPEKFEKELVRVTVNATPEQLKAGESNFNTYCAVCHVVAETGGGIAPDLAYSQLLPTEAYFQVVLDGLLLPNGMPKYAGRLSKSDAEGIRNFIYKMANQAAEKKK